MPVRKSAKAVSFKGTYRKSSEGGMHFVTVPAEVRSEFLTKGPARVVATIGTLEPFQCGLMPNSNGEGYIIVNKARQKRLGLEPGAQIPVSLSPDESEYGAPMPEELEAVLAQDAEARALFEGLTAGKKRAVMYAVARVKGAEGRIEAAIRALADPRTGHARW